MNISKEEAEKVAERVAIRLRCQISNEDLYAMRLAIVDELSPPPKLEWSFNSHTHRWFTAHPAKDHYWIDPTEDGTFSVAYIVPEAFMENYPTLIQAKAAAQGHYEADQCKQ